MNDPAAELLRPLQEGDAPALLMFYNGLSPASIRTFRPLGTKTTLEACVEIVRGNDPIRRTRYDLVAARAGEIMGWAFLARLDDPTPSLGLGIADASQGRRLGGALLDRLLAWARTQDVAGVCLIAVKDNARAIRLYESRGFVAHGEFVSENDGLPYVRMSVELGALPEPIEERRGQTSTRPAPICAP